MDRYLKYKTYSKDDTYHTIPNELMLINNKYQRLLSIIPHWIWEIDRHLRFVHSNDRVKDILGCNSGELIGALIEDILFSSEFNGVDFRSLLGKLLNRQERSISFEHCIRHQDQSVRHLKTLIFPNRDSDSQIIGYQGITYDQTSKINAEEDKRAIYNGAIDSIAVIHEQRDSYTSDHQRNVAKISVAIAQELGFDDRRTEGLRIAAVLHDIGKISIPAEILNRPSKLNKIEREIVRMHPKRGADIVGQIPFPWDIARFVEQHHERIDGSGYPRGLSGEQISIEAKIIGVADTLDSIVNHRPYKPAQDISKAIEIIKKEQGIKYDVDVVDAVCVLYQKDFFDFYVIINETV